MDEVKLNQSATDSTGLQIYDKTRTIKRVFPSPLYTIIQSSGTASICNRELPVGNFHLHISTQINIKFIRTTKSESK